MADRGGVGRVVDITTDGRHLSVQRGFLLVQSQGTEVGRVPLDDIDAVIASARALTFCFCSPSHAGRPHPGTWLTRHGARGGGRRR